MNVTRTAVRSFSTLPRPQSSTTVSFEEVRIPVPWGHIAGKWWGPQDKRPILVLHGWQDTCGSFDLLIPKLPKHVGYLAIDLVGHGHSSWLPPGQFYHGISGVMTLRHMQKYLKWDKLSLMGHSLGAITSYTFGLLYPQEVDFMMCLDGLQPLINTKGISKVTETMEKFLKYDEQSRSKQEPPCYTMEEMSTLLHQGTRKSIDLDKCRYILERNARESKVQPGKYYFGRDPRLKCGQLITWTEHMLKEAAKGVTFPLIFTLCDKSPFFSNAEYYLKSIENLKEINKDFQMVQMKGRHHGHLNDPEQFVPILSEFITKYDKADRSKTGIINEIKCNL